MSDSEVDDLQHFEAAQQKELARRAGIDLNSYEPEELSDEEVMGLHSSSDEGQDAYYDQDDETVKRKRERTQRELERNWGSTRDNYFGGEDDIGEDEGASEEEEAEAVRLQQQELEEMGEDDFVDEDDLSGWKTQGNAADDEVLETSVAGAERHIDPSTMTEEERHEFLEEKFPAVLLLSKELSKIPEWEAQLDREAKERPAELVDAGRAALSTYKGVIYTFFALFGDRISDLKGLRQLEEHPVNEALLLSRQLWQNYQAAGSHKVEDESSAEDGELVKEDVADLESEVDSEGLEEDLVESDEFSDFDATSKSSDESEDEFSIAKPATQNQIKMVGDFDETADTIEEQARAKNKQSLRFYTSQISKNDRKPGMSFSGDDDLPYRERDFERRERLLAEAKKRGEQQKDRFGDDGGNDGEDDAFDEAPMDDEALDLYNEARQQSSLRKHVKQQRHADALEAARAGRLHEHLKANPEADKRAINYQIEKNKGLTRKRKKENRNARVKKRVRYDAAQKRLKGVRKVYQGQQGPYQGELSGIRKNLSHSSKFKS